MPIQQITTGIIADGAVVATDIANGTVTGPKLGANSVSSNNIVSVLGSAITANTIANSAIQTGAVENYLRANALDFGMRNRIINGAMRIDQRNAGASATPSNGQYTLDRWQQQMSASAKFSVQRDSSANTVAGFTSSLKVTSLSAYSVSSTDYFDITQNIEGFNVADLGWGTANARPVTLSFWVRSSLTGTFGGSLMNNDYNRSNPYTYTISAADTWEYKTVTVAGDVTGTWLKTNGTGMQVNFSLGAGATRSGTAGTWAGSQLWSATGATSVVGTNGATWYITGVQLEEGSVPTPFEYRQYGTELALCQRYYFKTKPAAYSSISSGGYNSSTTVFQGFLQFPVTMRIAPTALEQSGTAGHYEVVNQNGATACSSVPSYVDATDILTRTQFTVSSGLTGGYSGTARTNNAAGFLAWSAEL